MAAGHLLLSVYPETSKFGEDVNDFVGLYIVDEDIREPEVLHKLQVHGDQDGLLSLIVEGLLEGVGVKAGRRRSEGWQGER